MRKKGDISVNYVIGAVIVVFVLVIVIFGIAKIFGWDINFFKNIPDLNRTVAVPEGLEKLRYNLGNERVQYYDGTQWVDFENDLRFSEKIVNYDSLKKGFEGYLFSAVSLEFETENRVVYKIIESNLKYFIIRAENVNPIKFLYGGGFFLSEKKGGEIEAGKFKTERILNSIYWKYPLSFDKEIIEQFRIEGGELYKHLSNLDGTYLVTKSQDEENRYYLSEYIFNDVENKLYASCGQNSEFYTWSANARGNIYCDGKSIDKIRISLDSGGFPDKIYVEGTRFKFGNFIKTIPKKDTGLRNAAFNAIFERPILISVFSNKKDFVGPPVPLYVCIEFRDEKYLVVDLKKEVNSGSVCRGGK